MGKQELLNVSPRIASNKLAIFHNDRMTGEIDGPVMADEALVVK